MPLNYERETTLSAKQENQILELWEKGCKNKDRKLLEKTHNLAQELVFLSGKSDRDSLFEKMMKIQERYLLIHVEKMGARALAEMVVYAYNYGTAKDLEEIVEEIAKQLAFDLTF